jgi:hypothetical protein
MFDVVRPHTLREDPGWTNRQPHPENEKFGHLVFSANGTAIQLCQENGFAAEGRYPRDIKFEDGTCAGTVAMRLLVKPPPAGGAG